MFPAQYNASIFIAQHGSWNREPEIGYRLMNAQVDLNGTTTSYSIFAEGWLQGPDTPSPGVWGAFTLMYCLLPACHHAFERAHIV